MCSVGLSQARRSLVCRRDQQTCWLMAACHPDMTPSPVFCFSSLCAAAGRGASLLPGSLLPPRRRPAAGTSPSPESILHVWPHQARDLLHAPRRGTSTRRAPQPHVGMLTPLPVPSFLPFCRVVFNLFQVLIPLPTMPGNGTIVASPPALRYPPHG